MIDEVLDQIETALISMHEKLPGVVVGTVSSLSDPMSLGRVQVKIPALDSSDSVPWARVAVPMAGSQMGMYFIPRVDDEVLVAFEHGSPTAPYVIGCLWNAKNPPPESSPLAEIRKIVTPAGIEVTLADRPPTVTIKTPGNEKIEIAPAGITIDSSTSKIEISAKQPNVKVTSGGNTIELASGGVTINASPSLTLKAASSIEIQAGASCTISAPVVKIN
ncbi:MAG TPA: phage baseplate assembly protein V [Gemmatimonadaceae bacterium]|nr:phage baseplate assembly protein V [Gemmatimonadaceae bacterium]